MKKMNEALADPTVTLPMHIRRDLEQRKWCEEIASSPAAEGRFKQAVLRLYPKPHGDDVFEYAERLEYDQWRMARQLDTVKIMGLNTEDLAEIIRRPIKDEQERSAWRRMCKKHGLSTGAEKRSVDQKAYSKVRYLESERGQGKVKEGVMRLYHMLLVHESEKQGSPECLKFIKELRSMVEGILKQ